MIAMMFAALVAGAAGQVPPISPTVIVTPIATNGPTPGEALAAGKPLLTPEEAVFAATEAGPRNGVRGVFEMPVQRAEAVGRRFFLNSQQDYRAQGNLSVAIHPVALKAVRERFGDDLSQAFLGRTVRVSGRAERVRVDLLDNGHRTGRYYYQTHVTVFDPRQIEVL